MSVKAWHSLKHRKMCLDVYFLLCHCSFTVPWERKYRFGLIPVSKLCPLHARIPWRLQANLRLCCKFCTACFLLREVCTKIKWRTFGVPYQLWLATTTEFLRVEREKSTYLFPTYLWWVTIYRNQMNPMWHYFRLRYVESEMQEMNQRNPYSRIIFECSDGPGLEGTAFGATWATASPLCLDDADRSAALCTLHVPATRWARRDSAKVESWKEGVFQKVQDSVERVLVERFERLLWSSCELQCQDLHPASLWRSCTWGKVCQSLLVEHEDNLQVSFKRFAVVQARLGQHYSHLQCPSFSLLFRTLGKGAAGELDKVETFAIVYTCRVGCWDCVFVWRFPKVTMHGIAFWQVHEKGVLFPSLAVCLLPDAVSEEWKPLAWILALHFQLVSLFSMNLGIVSWTEHSMENWQWITAFGKE